MTAASTSPDSSLLFEPEPLCPDYRLEQRHWRSGIRYIAGVDEAGRGPLAGPVVAAAVILPDGDCDIPGLNDSKKLTANEREALYEVVLDKALAASVASATAESIDASDIRKATLEAMCRAVRSLAIVAETALIDGRDVPPDLILATPAQAVIKGDCRSMSVAAASILAKVTRDRMMRRVGQHHPGYGLEKHMGYASAAHREAIGLLGGVKRIHRFSFSPFRERLA